MRLMNRSRSTLTSLSSCISHLTIVCLSLSAINTVILLLLEQTSSASAFRIESKEDALEYLSRFGYIHNIHEDNKVDPDEAVEGIREFQEFANLIPNGRLNRRTILAMNKPRCGNRDLRLAEGDEIGVDESESHPSTSTKTRFARSASSPSSDIDDILVRRKRYDLQGPRWRKKVLTYRITKFASSSLKPKSLQKEIDLAFKYWEREANITFRKVWDGKADIEISFFKGDHGDEESFDGPSKTLAHAFYPTKGRIHFDDEERWSANSRNGHNLRIVATHEIGHAMGLGHSTEKRAVMYLMYQGFKDKLRLHADDVSAIQKLYGPKISSPSGPQYSSEVQKTLSPSSNTAPGSPADNKQVLDGMMSDSRENLPDLCIDPKIDAITTLADGFIYIFKGEYFFRMKMGQPHSREHFPRRINETFYGLPSNLDTVLTISNGKTYFFKGRLYWRSSGTRIDNGYPKRIETNFLGVPNHLDASTVWSWNNMVYFFRGKRYWKYNFDQPRKLVETGIISKTRVSDGKVKVVRKNASGYPKRIATNWPGIPNGIEDAFLAPNGRTYFFKNGEYWQFHDPLSDQEAASYPRPSPLWWFGCKDFNTDQRRIRHLRNRNAQI